MAGALDPRMVQRDRLASAGGLFERNGFGAVAADADHDAINAAVDEVGGGGTEPRGEQPVNGGGRAAALNVAQDGDAGFEAGQFLKLFGKTQGIAGMMHFKLGKCGLGLFLFLLGIGLLFFVEGALEDGGVTPGHGAFGNGDNAEALAVAHALADGVGHGINVVGNFWNENHISAAGNPRTKRKPTGAVAHDFNDHNAVMAMGGAMEAVHGLGGDAQRRVVAEGHVGHGHVIIDGLGKGDDVETRFLEFQGGLLRAAAAEANENVQVVLFVILDDDVGGVDELPANGHAFGPVAAGAEDGAADGQDAGEGVGIKGHRAVFHDAAEAITKANDLHAEEAVGCLAKAADGSVEAGAVAAGGENADVFFHNAKVRAPAGQRAPARILSAASFVSFRPARARTDCETSKDRMISYCKEKCFVGASEVETRVMNYELKAGQKLQKRVRKIIAGQIREAADLLEKKPVSNAPIHGARKWLKKARAVLRLAKPALGEKAWKKEDKKIRRIARTLSARRDAQVLTITVTKLKDRHESPEVRAALTKLAQTVRKDSQESAGGLGKQERKGRAKLQTARRSVRELPLKQLDWPELSKGIAETYRAGATAQAAAGKMRAPDELHEWRKRVKDLWYQLRVIEPIQRKEISALAEGAKQLSLRLGDDHDLFMVAAAAKSAKLKRRELQLVLDLIEKERTQLQQQAFELGQKVYSESPATFEKKIEERAEQWAGQ